MLKHVFFFGKSESFSFKAYDENGLIPDYGEFIKDFDKLESTVFSVDLVDNAEILAKYRFNHGGRTYSLLKLYSYAQAFFSYRIEGSTYGVAFLSDYDIGITPRNIRLLKSLKDSFSTLSLNGLKFKYENFENDSTRIWQGFRNQSFFDKIEFGQPVQLAVSSTSIGIQLKDLLEIPYDVLRVAEKRSVVYLSTDRPHLERAKKRWDQYFDVFLIEKGVYTVNPKPQAHIAPPEAQEVYDRSYRSKKNKAEIESRIDRKNVGDSGKLHVIWILGVLLFLSMGHSIYLLYDKYYFDEKKEVIQTTVVVSPKVVTEPIRKDSIEKETVLWVIGKYDSLKKANGKRNKERLRKEMIVRLHSVGIDTVKLNNLLR